MTRHQEITSLQNLLKSDPYWQMSDDHRVFKKMGAATRRLADLLIDDEPEVGTCSRCKEYCEVDEEGYSNCCYETVIENWR